MDSWKQYKKAVRAALQCSRKQKDQLLKQLEEFKQSDIPDSEGKSFEQYIMDFGPPEEMANSLMENISKEELVQFQKGNQRLRFILCILIAAVIVGTIYIWFEKSNPVVVHDQITVGEEIKTN